MTVIRIFSALNGRGVRDFMGTEVSGHLAGIVQHCRFFCLHISLQLDFGAKKSQGILNFRDSSPVPRTKCSPPAP